MNDLFNSLSLKVSKWMGYSITFTGALLVVALWGAVGPIFHFSDTWQLFINTGTTILTFLMVFIIQNTQNRDNKALQLKIDELIRTNKQANNRLIDIEELTDKDLDILQEKMSRKK